VPTLVVRVLIAAVVAAVLPAAEPAAGLLDAGLAAGVPVDPLPVVVAAELPHAAIRAAAPAATGIAHHRLRILSYLRSSRPRCRSDRDT
jgi:hypothetical protein